HKPGTIRAGGQSRPSPPEMKRRWAWLFQKISRSHLGEAASGVLLIYSQSILHILEASSGTLYHILMDLQVHQGGELWGDIKIMVMSHNIPTRLFSQWNATKLEVPVTLEDVTQSQTTEEVITECLTLILKMGVYLATLKVRMGNKDLGECLHTTVPELLIPAETIQYLCRSQECLSPAEFLKMYKKPLHLFLRPQHHSVKIQWVDGEKGASK
uniref:Testis expressed 47 n=1 Tax=Laticauda laticaudata TaxID=8630 RepID=A0A8C5S9S7_LATLA